MESCKKNAGSKARQSRGGCISRGIGGFLHFLIKLYPLQVKNTITLSSYVTTFLLTKY